jgi:uncharacterized protein (TIGR00369 family)
MALYFAYGSNMASARLAARVPSPRPLGPARLAGFAWRCNKRAADGSAKANLVAESDAETWGVLWEIDAASWSELDRVEGGYERVAVEVEHGGTGRRAHTYVSDRIVEGTPPAGWYGGLVLGGAHEHALPAAWIATLEAALGAHAPGEADEDGGRMVFDDPANRCFGCSPHNPRGLALSFTAQDDGGVETVYVAAAELCGMHGVVHGGVQATMMDEAMGFAAHAALAGDGDELDIATVELAVRYHRPTPTGEPITLRARVVRIEGHDIWLEGEIRDRAGRICTEATSRWRRIARRID